MKTVILIILVIALVICFGTYPLSVIGKVFEFIAQVLIKLAKILNFFGWNGIMKFQL